MILNYAPPQAQVFQVFATAANVTTSPLPAHISGGNAFLLRYAVADEKILADLGVYDPNSDHSFPWPQLPVGGIVDPTYTAFFIDNARLEYFTDLIGVLDIVAPVSGPPNQVRIVDATYGFKTNGSLYPRFPLLYDRDVQPGDRVFVRGIVSSVAYTLDTYVQALAADQVAASIGTATSDSGNGTTQASSTTVAQTAGVVNCNTFVAQITGYSALPDGYINDTYTFTVLESSIDGDLSTAVLSMTSASGADNVASFNPEEVDTYVTVGSRGFQLKFTCSGHSISSLSTDDLIVGQTWTVAVHQVYKTLTPTAAGTYTGTANTTLIAKCTRGGTYAGTQPQITFTTTTGVDLSGPTNVTALGAAIAAGTHGVTISFAGSGSTGMRLGDTFYIPLTAASNGRYGTIVLGHNLPTQLLSATDLDLRLSIERNVQVTQNRVGFAPLVNWAQTSEVFTVESGLTATDPSLTNLGVLVSTPVVAGEQFVQYRAWEQTLVGALNSIDDVGLLAAAIPGPLTPDNPLAYGVFKALLNSAGTPVTYTAVSDPSSTVAWEDVLALLVGLRGVYSLAPEGGCFPGNVHER